MSNTKPLDEVVKELTEAHRLLDSDITNHHRDMLHALVFSLLPKVTNAAKELISLRAGFPDIGLDPLAHRDQVKGGVEGAQERLNKADDIQQKGVPDQTALVWRIDLNRLRGELTLVSARLKFAKEQAGHRQALLERALKVLPSATPNGSSHETCECNACQLIADIRVELKDV